MSITASMVKDLRDRTGAGMMDCKKALTECDGDEEKAIAWLREKGLSKAAKKAGRETTEGLITIVVAKDGKSAAMSELKCETDFVAKNEEFIALAEGIAKLALDRKTSDMTALPVEATDLTGLIGKIGENMQVGRLAFVELPGAGAIGTYVHSNKKLGVLVDGFGWFHRDPQAALRVTPRIYLHWGCAVPCRDTRDPVALAAAQMEALQSMERDHALLREHGYAIYLAPRLGVRESRRVVGETVITENDLRSGVLPPDTIAVGSYGIDNWGGNVAMERRETPTYGIPYRALVPADVDGLLIAGKAISGTHVASSAYRVMPIVGSIGQSAGIAAALCARHGNQPRELDPLMIGWKG